MANLYDLERHRLKLYGQMLRDDLFKQKEIEKFKKEQKLRQDSLQLQKHIQNTRRYEQAKKIEQRQINKAVEKDNKMLTTMKRSIHIPHSYAQQGSNFIQELQQMDNNRLDKIKRQLNQQYNDNQHQLTNRKQIQQKIRQIEQIEEERHNNRIKQMQMDSVRNHEETKRKHQQDMGLYNKHKRLLQENQHYKDQLESFTQGNSGILDRYNRNEYLQRRNNLVENQEAIKQQIVDLERRKSQQVFDYKKSIGDLEHSMLRSVLVKPQNNDIQGYNKELKHQMWYQNQRKQHEKQAKKEKIQMNNIFGGIHGNERQKMLHFIDKKLGIEQYQKSRLNNSVNIPQSSAYDDFTDKRQQRFNYENPQNRYNKPPSNEKMVRQNSGKSNEARQTTPVLERKYQEPPAQNIQPIQYTSSMNDNYNGINTGRSSEGRASSNGHKYFKSFDVISGKNKFYGYD